MTAREHLEHLDQLDQLRANASADGSWVVWNAPDCSAIATGHRMVGNVPTNPTRWIADEMDFDEATLAVAAVNALPQHTAALRAVLDLADQWDDDADAYDSLASDYKRTGAEADFERCEEQANQYRTAADDSRTAITNALNPMNPPVPMDAA